MKKTKKLFSVLMAMVMLITCIPFIAVETKAATLSLAGLQAIFPDGMYWNHYVTDYTESSNYLRDNGLNGFEDTVTSYPCADHESSGYSNYVGKYDCNRYEGATQCAGFVRRLAVLAYEKSLSSWDDDGTISSLKPGDIVHYYGLGASATWGHWVFVISVSGSTITVGECNWGAHCLIKWGNRSINLSNASSYTIYSAPYELSGGSTVTYDVDTRYPTPFKARTLSQWTTSDGKTQVYSSVNGAASGYIYNGYNGDDDNCMIEEVYTNGWCKVTVPGIDGYRYCLLSVFIAGGYTPSTQYIGEKIIVYTRSDMSEYYGYIDPGDTITKVGSSGSYTQLIYPLSSGGYRCGWANINTSSSADVDTRYPTPFEAYTLLWYNTSDGKTPVYDAINGNQQSYIYNGYNGDDDICTIEEVYTNGWCKITVPGVDGYRYCELSVFINIINGYNIWTATAPEWAQTYRRWDHGSPRGYIDAGDYIYIISETDTMYQVIYPTTSTSQCRWVDKCDVKHSYTSSLVEPTCTSQGYTLHTCSVCGESYTDYYTDIIPHNYSYSATKMPTLTSAGTIKGTCTMCSTTTNITMPALNSSDYTYSRIESATCTEGGLDRYTWNNTSYGTYFFDVSTSANGHNYVSTVVSPTCTEQGYTVYNCSDCGNSYKSEYTEANGHTYSYEVVTEPTVSTAGALKGTCNACDDAVTVTLPALNKTDYAYELISEATYTQNGIERYIFTAADGKSFSFDVSIPMLDSVCESIEIATLPVKTTYYVGEAFASQGLTLNAIYSNGNEVTVDSGFSVYGFSSATAGTCTVTVNYEGLTASFNVTIVNNVEITGKYILDDVTGNAGSTVSVYLSIADNPGIISLRSRISYDTSVLELVKVENTGLLSGYTVPSANITSPYTLRWSDSLAVENNSANGEIVKLTFLIKEGAECGDYSIGVTHIESRDFNGNKLYFSDCTATVSVVEYITGDVDNDGEISDWDAILLSRYLAGWETEIVLAAADVDKDGEVSDWDAIMLERYLAGWDISI